MVFEILTVPWPATEEKVATATLIFCLPEHGLEAPESMIQVQESGFKGIDEAFIPEDAMEQELVMVGSGLVLVLSSWFKNFWSFSKSCWLNPSSPCPLFPSTVEVWFAWLVRLGWNPPRLPSCFWFCGFPCSFQHVARVCLCLLQ